MRNGLLYYGVPHSWPKNSQEKKRALLLQAWQWENKKVEELTYEDV